MLLCVSLRSVFRPATVPSSAPTTPRARRRGRADERVGVLVGREYCRSPVAQGVFEAAVRREGLEDKVVEVDSAGTGGWHAGQPPDERALESAGLRGLNISHLRARQVTPEDCRTFDYVLTMDEDNYQAVSALCGGSAVVRPFLDFATGSPEREVPDPYCGGPDGFERVLNLVEEASEGLIEDIRGRHLNPGG
jgi:protein-tyrosine phosphatase